MPAPQTESVATRGGGCVGESVHSEQIDATSTTLVVDEIKRLKGDATKAWERVIYHRD